MKVAKYFPGIILSALIAAFAMWLESLFPVHIIGSAVIAMFIGMLLNGFLKSTDVFSKGIKFTSKKLLKFAIILLGLSLNITTVLHVGKMSLTVMIFTLLTCFGGGYFVGRALKLNWTLSNLISAGTGICGGSAIAAVSTVIDADDDDAFSDLLDGVRVCLRQLTQNGGCLLAVGLAQQNFIAVGNALPSDQIGAGGKDLA